jgi:hypothetical protein
MDHRPGRAHQLTPAVRCPDGHHRLTVPQSVHATVSVLLAARPGKAGGVAVVRPLEWLTAVRDHPDRPPPKQCHVLTCLALRVDWRTGRGFASTAQLAADADCGKGTVQRATTWVRKHRMAKRTKRGHALRDGSGMASEWELLSPEPGLEGGTADPFQNRAGRLEGGTADPFQTPAGRLEGTSERLEGPNRRLEGACTDPPSIPVTSISNPSSARERAGDRAVSDVQAEGSSSPPRPDDPEPGNPRTRQGTEAERRRQHDALTAWMREHPEAARENDD